MSGHSIDYAISGFSLVEFDILAHRLLDLADRLVIVDLHVWGQDGRYHRASFGEGSDLRDARNALEVAPALASRLGCLFRVPIEEGYTNITLSLVRRGGWTLVEGQLYVAQLLAHRTPRIALGHVVRELVRIANDLQVSMLNVVDEDASPLIAGTEIQRPMVLSIFDPELLPSLVSSSIESAGKRLLCLVESATFLDGGAPDVDGIERFCVACAECGIGQLLASRSRGKRGLLG